MWNGTAETLKAKPTTWVALFTATGVILGATYALWLYRRVVFGELTRSELKKILDLSPRETAMFVPIILIVLWLGIYPKPFLDVMHPAVERLLVQTGSLPAPVPEMIRPETAQAEGEAADVAAEGKARKAFRADEQVHEENMIIETPEGVSIDVMEADNPDDAPTAENTETLQDDIIRQQHNADTAADSQE